MLLPTLAAFGSALAMSAAGFALASQSASLPVEHVTGREMIRDKLRRTGLEGHATCVV